jgi:hypothetical protein
MMDAVDWSAIGVLAALKIGCAGYLARQLDRVRAETRDEVGGLRTEMHDEIAGLRNDLGARVDRLADAYLRHLEHHAGR